MKIFRKIFLLLFTLFLLCSCQKQEGNTTQGEKTEKLKVAFVYVGPVGDGGWSYTHDKGRQAMEKELPFVETTYIENVPENADAERVFTELCEKGCKLIFGTTHYMGVMQKVAEKYPDVIFEECTGYETSKNIGIYFGKIEQARYLTGLMAGQMTKTSKIGYVAAHTIPEVIRGLNAFTLGVRKVNPEATVHVVWTHTWYDPAKEREGAESLVDIGVDIIAQHQDSSAAQQVAESRGIYSIGYNSDMTSFAPKAHLTAPVWNWTPFYTKTVKEVYEGTWQTSSYWGDMKDGTVGLAPFGPMVPEDVKILVEKEKQAFIDGKLDVFAGPIKDQHGKERIPKGKSLTYTDKDLVEMEWLVEGVAGELPGKK